MECVPKLSVTISSTPRAFDGHLYDYESHSGMLVPTGMDIGWWTEKGLMVYFVGKNIEFDYKLY
jgi:hypothetical protein